MFRWRRLILALVSASVMSVATASCGTSPDAVAHVGSLSIAKSAVAHWTRIESHEPGKGGLTPHERALERLITSSWLVGEAASRHLTITDDDVLRRIATTRADSFPGGEPEFHQSLRSSGRTTADVRLEARTELAYLRIRASLAAQAAAQVSSAEIAAFYLSHKERYLAPERRFFDIDNLHSKAAALKVRSEVSSGESFSTKALHESLTRTDALAGDTGKAVVERAIFAAKAHALQGPVLFEPYRDYSLFEVSRIMPGSYRSLKQVSGGIRGILAERRQKLLLARFASAWRARWVARTDCNPGFVVQTCRQYRGVRVLEAPLRLLG
jgi:hypothetical protein